jgi:acetyl-CoA carboxylase carboxyl transferase subunit beta
MDDHHLGKYHKEKKKEEKFMSLMNWFEDKRRFGGLISALIEKATKGYILSDKERDKYIKIDTTKGLWTRCDNCKNMFYVRFLRQNKRICEMCGYHLQMSSTKRIELLIDRGTWYPMDKDMIAQHKNYS